MGCAAPSGERLLLLLQLPDPLLSSLPAFLGSAMQLLSCNACAVMVNTCLVHWGGGERLQRPPHTAGRGANC